MDLQERLEAEVWAQIMGHFMSILAEGVRKFGGTVDKSPGTGSWSCSGAAAQEDQAGGPAMPPGISRRRSRKSLARSGERWAASSTDDMLTVFGVVALTFMMTMYALEHRHHAYVAAFALGCAASSGYGFLSGAWPFGVVEGIWCVLAWRRYRLAVQR